MENASKALLIAAAVLIVILIIAFGMRIFNSTGDASSQVDTQSQTTSVQTYNSMFTGYLGDHVSATSARAVILAAAKASPVVQVNGVNTQAAVLETKTYKIEVPAGGYDANGYITTIQITQN